MLSRSGFHRRAQKAIEAIRCERCPSTENLHRHHPNYDDPLNVIVLCRPCHDAEHVRLRRPHRMKSCLICEKRFLPNHSKKHNTCSRECLSEIGRRNAMKRWHPLARAALLPVRTLRRAPHPPGRPPSRGAMGASRPAVSPYRIVQTDSEVRLAPWRVSAPAPDRTRGNWSDRPPQ